jgi:hypothetical protein
LHLVDGVHRRKTCQRRDTVSRVQLSSRLLAADNKYPVVY